MIKRRAPSRSSIYTCGTNKKGKKSAPDNKLEDISPLSSPHSRSLSNMSATAAIANLYETAPENPSIYPPPWSRGCPLMPSSIHRNPLGIRLPRWTSRGARVTIGHLARLKPYSRALPLSIPCSRAGSGFEGCRMSSWECAGSLSEPGCLRQALLTTSALNPAGL